MNSVIKGAGYVLAHTPDLMLHNGSTQTTERIVNPESEYLKEMGNHVRPYEKVVDYWPNQVYIGNATPEQLSEVEFPYYDKSVDGADRYGKFGEIMPEAEFYLLTQACDAFEVFHLDKAFVSAHKDALAADPLITPDIMARVAEGMDIAEIQAFVDKGEAEGLYYENALVGCCKRAHDIDENLSAEVMLENLTNKATSVLSILHGLKAAGMTADEIEYVIDCSEEACGDVNQRGGGNFAKAAAEMNSSLSHRTQRDFANSRKRSLISPGSRMSPGFCARTARELTRSLSDHQPALPHQ